VRLQVDVEPGAWFSSWAAFLKGAGNPLAPTLEEAMEEALTPAEAERFEAHLRPLAETGGGLREMAAAFLWATKR
jgi:arsenite methyltransferase